MKSLFVLLALCVTTFQISAKDEPKTSGIQFFHGSWKEALAKAKAEKKLIFFDAYTSWCGPCKWMQTKSFPNKQVGELYNAKFINVKFDMEEGEGITLSDKYPVQGYPTLFFIDGNGKVVKQVLGAQTPEQLLAVGKQVSKDEQ
ncbi:MAG: thioredoxin family protein [Siphonobacter sp.]